MADNAARLAWPGHRAASCDRPELRLSRQDREPASPGCRAAGRARVAGRDRRAGAPCSALRMCPSPAKMRLATSATAARSRRAGAGRGRRLRLVIHARTNQQGYKPPAYWHKIAQLKRGLPSGFPVVANGDLDGGRRPPGPGRVGLRRPDAGPGPGHPSRLALAIRRADESWGLDDAGLAQAEGPEWSWGRHAAAAASLLVEERAPCGA